MGFPGTRSPRSERRADTEAALAEPTPASPDWPVQATDSIIRLVDNVRDKTAGPAITASRVFVYGFVIALLGVPLAVLLLVGMMRALESVLEIWFTDPIWMVYLIFGTTFVLVGFWCWRQARKPALSN
jgi:hypothetical protein